MCEALGTVEYGAIEMGNVTVMAPALCGLVLKEALDPTHVSVMDFVLGTSP